MDRKITLCDVGIEGCQTDEEREEWCMREFDMTYAEYLEVLNSNLPAKVALEKVFDRKKHSE